MLRINGERAATPDDYQEAMSTIVDTIESLNLPASRIFNWDETGIFYRSLPKYTLAPMGDSGAGGKDDKARVTALVCVNGDGSHRSIVLIGQSKVPRGTGTKFWRDNGVRYFSNENSWMTREIFGSLLADFDHSLDGPAVLLLDNFSGHHIDEFIQARQHIIPVYLPPNTTAVTQPLDLGIISVFKMHYRKHLVDYVCQRIEEGNFRRNEISFARIVPWLTSALDAVRPRTIQKSFYNALKLERFKPEEESSEGSEVLMMLSEAITRHTGKSLTADEVIEYVNDERLEQTLPEEEVMEEINIRDPADMLKCIDSLIKYFRNTGRNDQARMLASPRETILNDLNYGENHVV